MFKKFLGVIIGGLLSLQNLTAFAEIPDTLKVATGYFYPPFVYSSKPSPYGFDIALLRAVCDQIRVNCILTQMPLTELFNSLANRNLDIIIGGISITPDRKARFEFSIPYFKSTMSYVGLATTNYAITPEGLKGKKIGAVKGSTFAVYLTQVYGNNIKLREYSSLENALSDVANSDIDLVLVDTPVANYWQTHSSNKLKIIDRPLANNVPFDEGFGIAVQKGNYELVNAINNALITLYQNGTYDQLRHTYLNQHAY